MSWKQTDLEVESLSPRDVPSPLALSTVADDDVADYVPDDARVALDIETRGARPLETLFLEKAGPRTKIHFDPARTRAGIVTCGGICPGINNVLRSLVLELHHKYRVGEVVGFRYGYEGLNPNVGLPPMMLGPDEVRSIHTIGGTLLGLSRGKQPIDVMVDTLVAQRIQVLFAVGGDGTLRGARAIAEEARRRGLDIAIVGVPKTIDNDVAFVDKTFGFETAVEVARAAVDAAHVEAHGARNGVAIVKLMGRDSGFIACSATLASAEANFCLIPEVRFELGGERGLLATLERRLETRGHAVIVVAEGCGAALAASGAERDASGNVRYGSAQLDVGPRLRDVIVEHFRSKSLPITVKYIDPSYMIRSVPANANDAAFCDALARNAVHAGMAGKTNLVIGRRHRVFVHVPIAAATATRKQVDPDGELWLAVCETTGQPRMY